ncbi:hypothetical protein WH06_25815 [Aeromonas salmonicida subsp. salmonicida]|jgi:hypothetical protein|uniref:Uncharacterized protein n=6 Tax=Aeromonas salmonicida TaxID=645 RepID=A4SLB3_AERS4|nr:MULTISPECIES: hypothetical protein [Aeromonas]ABO89685.1 hypothetical protein ASA_1600 [Aeromonas salmonicida subsp. salmonicida A449]ABO91821.1 hypothetical protein ASA_3867 [Aeromonas salmonicida subsp. salmonicida A449]AYO62768.1 hypothetical protein C5P03_08045 [Aeromonas salmonicida subsp. salmonicida 01-B526]AYO64637.1 hypothetical protein C5P03_18830 [Aeromonas salmonicida subsp. salmonicida 01-B526]EHI50064.1 hypothetical protein IYQ_23651 [Aeromonas salmonicida subsp. salmonicida 0
MQQPNTEQRNLAGLTPLEQIEMNTAGCLLLRELFGMTRSSLDTDWLAISSAKKAAICAIAHQPRGELMTATLSALPHQQREAIRLAVIALDYQGGFRCGCDTKLWHPAPTTRPMGDIEREKKERAAKLRMKRAVLAASEMSRQGPCAIGQ